jgi:formiminoglutamase
MKNLVLFTETDRNNLVTTRDKETKFGELVKCATNYTSYNAEILNTDVKYVLIGISETIGIQSNLGFSKAEKTFNATLKVLLNTQSNQLSYPEKVLVLGQLVYPELQEELKKLNFSSATDLKKARRIVEIIDKDVSILIYDIIKAGKTPIVIGGGHNNAYGNLKGTALALNQPLNAINFDAHTDFRLLEGRHSGNGFSYAKHEGFLNNYFMFGLHENYLQQNVLEVLNEDKSLDYNTYEALEVRNELSFEKALYQAEKHCTKSRFGLELDCDAIINITSSAQTPSGFSVVQTRQFINHFAKFKNLSYFHICEASCTKKTEKQLGKLLSYFILDFINANHNL